MTLKRYRDRRWRGWKKQNLNATHAADRVAIPETRIREQKVSRDLILIRDSPPRSCLSLAFFQPELPLSRVEQLATRTGI